MYRVFWRPLGSRESLKMDTEQTEITIDNLADGTTYECVVKAGNNLGFIFYRFILLFFLKNINNY